MKHSNRREKGTWKRIWGYVGKYKTYLIGVFICGLVGNMLLILGPLLTGQAIDQMIGTGAVKFPQLLKIILILLLLYLLSSIFQWLMSIVSNVAANKTIHDLRQESFQKINRLPLKYFDNTPHGDTINRITNDLDAISDGLFQGITQIMSAVISITGCFLFMLLISPLITIVVLVVTPLCFFIAAFIAKHSANSFSLQSKTTGELNGYVEEMVTNMQVLKAYGHENEAVQNFKEINQRLYQCGQKAQWYASMTNPTTRLVNNIAYVGVTVLGGVMAIQGNLTIGKIASFLTYSSQFAKPINEITSISTQIQSALASAERVFKFLDEPEEEQENETVDVLRNCRGEVEFRDVKFSYRPDVPFIRRLNLKVQSGQMVAIVGPTGSGKTTLVNLLMRFYDVDSGHIMIDGNNITKMTRESLRSSIGMVLQDSWLFAGTIAENIGYGKEDASKEEIIQAAKEAKADSFIRKMPKGYDTILDEEGSNLSQGQRQLLTIARVMLMDPPVLILDEATSSIDTRTEITIQRAFTKMMRGRTSFVIAHRLSTIREADIILVLKDGDIIEQGSHNALLDQGGFYYQLYNSQFNVPGE
ncbi:ABC transporter ATP-binding protein [Anaeromicropila populeti]|uniref:ATP-binding cassette, subfamily B n=1 Tax=Anaeromicropila populeti TaxID=37658 RepID=A0A1I6IQ89_9FIRM|nr:ABC transporter ATP-binding protein [Anaeromicropila populeti]SFR68915.1 ATP-binding cassette, subfamily B [Anaeromicropila populeti]